MRTRIAFLITAVAASTAACSAVARQVFEEPVVRLDDVRVQGLGLTGGSMDVVLKVHNPNDYRLDATRLTYRILVDSVPFADGAIDDTFVVAAGDSTVVTVPVSFTYAGIGEAGRQLLNTGAVNYRVAGDVTVGTPVGRFTIPYDRTGRFSALGGRQEE